MLVEGASIRVEMIREARIALGPAASVPWTTIPVLSEADAFAEKLLANSDRWADRDDLSRDLIDLAILRITHAPVPLYAWKAVEEAYGRAARLDLRKAATRFLAEPDYQQRCFVGLNVEGSDKVISGVMALLSDTEQQDETGAA